MSAYSPSRAAGDGGLASWHDAPLADLVANLTDTHHAYLRAELPRLAALTAEAAAMPGPHGPALREAAARLERFSAEMLPHLDREERDVFPLIVGLERGEADREAVRKVLAGQLSALELAHVGTSADLDELHRICDTVPAPADAEPVLGALLDAFARVIADTHAHVQKENEVLLPRAIALLA